MRLKLYTTTALVGTLAGFAMGGMALNTLMQITPLHSQQLTNPVSVLYSSAATAAGIPIAVSTANALPVNIVAGSGSGCAGTSGTPCIVAQATAANLNMTEANSAAIYTAVTSAIPSGSNNIGSVVLATGSNVFGTLATGTNNIGLVTLATSANVIGTLATGTNNIGSVTLATGANVIGTLATGANVIGYTSNDPCIQALKTNVAIATSATAATLVAGVSAKKVYICSLFVLAGAATVVNIVEQAATCSTISTATGIVGSGTTAANGVSLAINGGWTQGNGAGTVMLTATTADYVCIWQSGANAVAGNLTYVQQ